MDGAEGSGIGMPEYGKGTEGGMRRETPPEAPTDVLPVPLLSDELPARGGGDSSGLDANYPPPTNRWPEAPLGGGGGGLGRGVLGGAMGGGGPGGAIWDGAGGTCPQGQALVNHRLPLPSLALPLTIHPPPVLPHPREDGPPPPPGEPHHHHTRTFSGTEIALQNERIQWQHAHKRCNDMHHLALNIQRPAPKQVPLRSG